ncbi:haloacid dehalogenase-like hydrolase [bacterium]|nr:haloacid dehalogenase-like hydrolase [bacterium]
MNKFVKVDEQEIMDRVYNEAPKDAVWVFDCDGTLINSDISTFTGWSLVKNGMANPDLLPEPWVKGNKGIKIPFDEFEAIIDHVTKIKGVTGCYEWEIELQSGLSPKMVMEVATEVLEVALKEGHIRYTRHVAKLAERVKENAWVVSGSSHPTVSAITAKLGIPPNRVLATTLETLDGIYQMRFEDPGIIWEETKRVILERNNVKEPYFVAGDTIGDWFMMLMPGKWRWCVLWDDYRHRGIEWRNFLKDNCFKGIEIPMEAGFYTINHNNYDWVIEIKGDFS